MAVYLGKSIKDRSKGVAIIFIYILLGVESRAAEQVIQLNTSDAPSRGSVILRGFEDAHSILPKKREFFVVAVEPQHADCSDYVTGVLERRLARLQDMGKSVALKLPLLSADGCGMVLNIARKYDVQGYWIALDQDCHQSMALPYHCAEFISNFLALKAQYCPDSFMISDDAIVAERLKENAQYVQKGVYKVLVSDDITLMQGLLQKKEHMQGAALSVDSDLTNEQKEEVHRFFTNFHQYIGTDAHKKKYRFVPFKA